MTDFIYAERLEDDLLTQFHGQKNNTAIMRSYARQLQEVYAFLKSLLSLLDLDACTGPQLDLIGEIVVLSRYDARIIVGDAYEGQILNDDLYRKIIKYKIIKNTSDCTYWSIIKGIKMFWDKPLYYSEYPDKPATIFLRTDELSINDHVEDLLHTPIIIKAAGVGIHVVATIRFFDIEESLHVGGASGSTVVLPIPAAADEFKWLDRLRAGGGMALVSTLPVAERN